MNNVVRKTIINVLTSKKEVVTREITPEEIKAIEYEAKRLEAQEKRKPLTPEEVNSLFISQQINTLKVDDSTALKMKAYYPTFESLIGKTVEKGFKFAYGDKLYRVLQSSLLIQEHYKPDSGTESLYEVINEQYDGDIYDPIPYEGNMALENGKYYTQNSVIYLCNRDTVNPVYNPLNELIGLYVEVAEIE